MCGQHPVPGVFLLHCGLDFLHLLVMWAPAVPQISSPVLAKLVTHRPLIKRAVIMFQAEFAERLTAEFVGQQVSSATPSAQASLDSVRCLHVSQAWIKALQPAVRQHAAYRQRAPRLVHSSGPLPAATQGRLHRGRNCATGAAGRN